ncbi:hypothetical protein F2Q68_00039140 [Brassica cretica]|uniref:Uncharacterized protein n=1 Tax=Brassica cretica TaxID=69181 RepID=A0A8S9MPI0_BRACR|nr:hypothetical protein F2Q68_00039140 [Brassica cretica]
MSQPSIDGDYAALRSKLVTEKSLQDKLDEITFSQDLVKEDVYHELKDISELKTCQGQSCNLVKSWALSRLELNGLLRSSLSIDVTRLKTCQGQSCNLVKSWALSRLELNGLLRSSLSIDVTSSDVLSFYLQKCSKIITSRENPEAILEPKGSSLDPEIFDWNPEAIGEPGGTVLCLPRKDYYRLRACWCGCYDPSVRLHFFPRLEKQGFDCSLYFTGPRYALGCTGVLGSFDSILRLAHTHSCFMSHTHFDFVDVPLWSCHFLQGLARIGDEATEGRRLRKRKEKIPKNLKREANEKEMDGFTKRVLRIPVKKLFVEVYFTHRLWIFFRETKETEEDIRRMFHHVRERMKLRITLKKKSDHGKFAIPCVVKGIGFPHALCDTGASVNLVELGNDLGYIAAYHCGAEYETEYSESIDTHTASSIDSNESPMTDGHYPMSLDGKKPVDHFTLPDLLDTVIPSSNEDPTEEYDEDYWKERSMEIAMQDDTYSSHSFNNTPPPSIDRVYSASVYTHPHPAK